MNNKSFLMIMLTLGFVGATSCGDDKAQSLQMENQALKATLAQQMNKPPVTTTATETRTQTQTQTTTTFRTVTGTNTQSPTTTSTDTRI